jgi:signal transduction histidine kinase
MVCAILCITTMLTPSLFFTSLLHGFLLMLLVCIVYLIAVFVKAYRRKRLAAGYGLMSVGILAGIQVMVELEYFGMTVSSKTLIFTGHVLFFFLQSLILSSRFSYSLKKARNEAEMGLKTKSEFLSTMSHEIRTPLNSVIGMSNLMLLNSPRPDQMEQLKVLQFSARNLLSIVNDILDYNKIEAGKISFERIDMNLREIASLVVAGASQAAADKGIGIRFEADASLSRYVLGDPTRLSQVLHNLVNNAVKFTGEGEVTLELTVLDQRKESISVLFTVQDTGIGIPPEKQQLIFERFTQADSSTSRSFGGTGLGLAISQGILHLQGSKLMLNSEPGKGSTFFFTLSFPLGAAIAPEITDAAPISATLADKPLTGTRILLVEDNRINVMVARNFLEGWGASIDVAENGQEALDRLDTEHYQLVLMDLHMPVMDGYTAIRKIRGQGMTVPVIALTASLPNEVEQECSGMEIDGFVLKPFLPDELFCKVQQAVSKYISA